MIKSTCVYLQAITEGEFGKQEQVQVESVRREKIQREEQIWKRW